MDECGERIALASFEHAEMLRRSVLPFIGIREPEFVIAEALAVEEGPKRAAIASALNKAKHLAVDS